MLDAKQIAKIEVLYRGETTVNVCPWAWIEQWQTQWPDGWVDNNSKTHEVIAALTTERLWVVEFGAGWFGKDVSTFVAFDLADIARFQWGFSPQLDTKGRHVGYTFFFGATFNGQAAAFQYGGPPPSVRAQQWFPQFAEPFQEAFAAAIARRVALAAPVDMAAQLRALQALVDEGVMSLEEMTRAKNLFLGQPPDRRQIMERNLRSLHELRKSGVLNQIEFDIKKQDILAARE